MRKVERLASTHQVSLGTLPVDVDPLGLSWRSVGFVDAGAAPGFQRTGVRSISFSPNCANYLDLSTWLVDTRRAATNIDNGITNE